MNNYRVEISFISPVGVNLAAIEQVAGRISSDCGWGVLAGPGGCDCGFDDLSKEDAEEIERKVRPLLFVKTVKVSQDHEGINDGLS